MDYAQATIKCMEGGLLWRLNKTTFKSVNPKYPYLLLTTCY